MVFDVGLQLVPLFEKHAANGESAETVGEFWFKSFQVATPLPKKEATYVGPRVGHPGSLDP